MRGKKLLLAFVVLLTFLLGVMPAFADSLDLAGITTFGYNDLRDRSSGVTTLEFWPAWMSDFGFNGTTHSQDDPGTSYSQPLIVYDPSGRTHQMCVIAAGGGTSPVIAIWKDKQATPGTTYLRSDANRPVWSAALPGSLATMSHPSLYEMNGRDILFIGTNAAYDGAHILAWDVTNVIEGTGSSSETPLLDKADPYASEIVSAPLLEYWQGQEGEDHPVVIYTNGDKSQVDICYNIDDLANGQSPIKPIFQGITIGSGGGATTSSPAPVMNETAFVMGWDDGGSNGAIYVYRLDDIFTTAADGSMTVQSAIQPYLSPSIHAGMDQSFSVDPNNTNVIYFGDSRSNIYGYDTASNTWLWLAHNADIPNTYGYPDDFSNRSPALDGNNIYFPFGTGTSTPFGGVIAVNKSTGATQWISNGGKSLVGYDQYGNPLENGNTNTQTAPVVATTSHPSGEWILEGLGDGQVVALDPSNGTEYPWLSQSSGAASQISSYAKGITGEISAYGEYFAMTFDGGILAATLLPCDLAITGPNNTPGLTIMDGSQPVQQDPQGNYVVQAGKTYTVKVDYEYVTSPSGDFNDTTWDLPNVPVAWLHNVGGTWNSQTSQATGGRWYSVQTLTDQNGQALPQKSLISEYSQTPQNEFYVDLQHQAPGQGSTGEYDFQWTPSASDAGSTNFIGAAINTNFQASNPLIQMYPDDPLTNNLAEVPVKIEAPELVLTPTATTGTGSSYTVNPPYAAIPVYGTAQFDAEYYPEGRGNSQGQVVTTDSAWTSSDTEVASVGHSTGLATGVSGGDATITAAYDGLTGTAQIHITQPYQPPQSGTGLTFEATSQSGGIQRSVNTAKWTDYVTVSLMPLEIQNHVTYGDPRPDYGTTVAPPYPPAGPYGAPRAYSDLTGWSFAGATLEYPQQNPDYSFGHPLPPSGTVAKPMSTGTQVSRATIQEMWAEDGTPVFDVIAGQDVGPAKDYTLTADHITVDVNYSLTTWHWVALWVGGYWAPATVNRQVSQSLDPVSGQLLVNGTGAAAEGL